MENNLKKILVVDDDDYYLEIMRRYLFDMKFEPLIAKSGEEAILAYKRSAPHVILLDLMLPDKNGFDVAKEIRKEESYDDYTPIIVITAKFESDDFVDVFKSGADDYILKPFRRYEFESRLRSAVKLKDYHLMLKEKKDALEKLLKMKDEFLSMVTHDIKNYLLSILLGCSAMCDEKANITLEKHKAFAKIINKKAKLMTEIVSNLLTTTKYELNELVLNENVVDLKLFLTDFYNGYQELNIDLNHEFLLDTAVDKELGMVSIDTAKIDEVLTNLVTNARKYGREGGKIVINATNYNKDYFVVSVYDTGIGIPSDRLDGIFDKFSQLDKKKGGSGLGLAICKDIVKAHGGNIWAESEIEKWSKFSFTLKKKIN